jgi:hypothetical protein
MQLKNLVPSPEKPERCNDDCRDYKDDMISNKNKSSDQEERAPRSLSVDRDLHLFKAPPGSQSQCQCVELMENCSLQVVTVNCQQIRHMTEQRQN